MDNKLNSRCWALYNYLKNNSDQWVTQKEIALALPSAYPCTVEDMQDFHNCHARHLMTADVRTLNESGLIQKIILSSAKGVKIASEEEFDRFIGRQINSAVRRLQRVKSLAEKGNRNGQCKITLGKYERDFIEAFVRG